MVAGEANLSFGLLLMLAPLILTLARALTLVWVRVDGGCVTGNICNVLPVFSLAVGRDAWSSPDLDERSHSFVSVVIV